MVDSKLGPTQWRCCETFDLGSEAEVQMHEAENWVQEQAEVTDQHFPIIHKTESNIKLHSNWTQVWHIRAGQVIPKALR